MANIEIDGKKIEAELGMMIIEAADANEIWIPRFCYHKKLSIAANCRMCLIEVEKAPKALPACATPISDGMKIWTKSKKARLAQQSVMEFLLINHPLDCPICDQGGECELQDISMGYGKSHSRYHEKKRAVQDQDLGPLIATDMTRCIQCTRCVRFGTEIAGFRELGAIDRGEAMKISTFIEKNIDSEVSGNIIELCPVGALTSKPYRFSARAWELQQKPSIAPHDCIGTNIYVHTRNQMVKRVVPRENEEVNEIWISDRDRYSYCGLYHERLIEPRIKRNGIFEKVSWEDALEYTADKLKALYGEQGSKSLAAVVSPNVTTEEAYLCQQLVRGLGSNNIDHRLRCQDFRGQDLAPAFPNLGVSLPELEHQSLVLLVGAFPREEQPLLALRLRKLTSQGQVMVINPFRAEFNFDITAEIIAPNADLYLSLARVAKAVLELSSQKISDEELNWLATFSEPNDIDKQVAKALLSNEQSLILLGSYALTHPDGSGLIALSSLIQKMTGAKFGTLTEGANAAGAWLAGAVPHRLPGGQSLPEPGLNMAEIWREKLKAYILLGVEPDLDCRGSLAMKALENAQFVVAITPFESDALNSVADVLLPSTPFTETSGTYINISGIWQSFKAVVPPLKDSRPAWKILRVLGNFCDLPGFDFNTSEEVLFALKQEQKRGFELEKWDFRCPNASLRWQGTGVIGISELQIYASDSLVRRSLPLQKTEKSKMKAIRINHATLKKLGIEPTQQVILKTENSEMSYVLSLKTDNNVPDNVAVLPLGVHETRFLNGHYSALNLRVVDGGNS